MKIVEWFNISLLSLNADKCNVISYEKHINILYNYHMEDIDIQRRDLIKDLGVLFDSKLKFDSHT